MVVLPTPKNPVITKEDIITYTLKYWRDLNTYYINNTIIIYIVCTGEISVPEHRYDYI